MSAAGTITKFLVWRIKHISNKNFVLVLSAVIGVLAGIAAVTLKRLTHLLHHLLTHYFDPDTETYYRFAFPLVGLLITVFLAKYVFREKLGHGVSTILFYISKGSSIMKKRMIVSRWLTAIFTVGFGGSVGLEAPIVTTGSAIGATLAKQAHLNYKKRTVLIGCGVAAAISAIFNAPVAGVIFSMEVVLAESTITNFIPLLIASSSGKLVSMVLGASKTTFQWNNVDSFTAGDAPYYLGLGVFCGFMALYFTVTQYYVEDRLENIKSDWHRVLIGGSLLCVLIFIFPPLYGEGYNIIRQLLEGGDNALFNDVVFGDLNADFLLGFIALMVLAKAVASALTIGSGGSGGIFAPSLFVGGISGALFAQTVKYLNIGSVSTINFTLVGMCGVMGAIQHAPLSAIFLIAEMTGGYQLFIPLMIVSAISYMTKTYFEPYSLYTKRLIEKGDLITGDRDKQVLSLLRLDKLIEKNFITVNQDAMLSEMIEIIKECQRNVFPVLDNEKKLVGILRLDDIRRIMFDQSLYEHVHIKTFMQKPRATIIVGSSMTAVMNKFESTGTWNLAVVDEEGVYIGMISKSNVFNAYRTRLIRQNKE